jgi:hypothetical protein
VTDEMKVNAKRETELILREAKLAGERIVEEARADEARIVTELKTLKRTRRQLIEDLRATLAQYQRLFVNDIGAEDDDAR